jgi:hypothetical protein
MPLGKRIPRLGRITVVFGRPSDPEELERQGPGDEPQARIVNALHDRVAALGRLAREIACDTRST